MCYSHSFLDNESSPNPILFEKNIFSDGAIDSQTNESSPFQLIRMNNTIQVGLKSEIKLIFQSSDVQSDENANRLIIIIS